MREMHCKYILQQATHFAFWNAKNTETGKEVAQEPTVSYTLPQFFTGLKFSFCFHTNHVPLTLNENTHVSEICIGMNIRLGVLGLTLHCPLERVTHSCLGSTVKSLEKWDHFFECPTKMAIKISSHAFTRDPK